MPPTCFVIKYGVLECELFIQVQGKLQKCTALPAGPTVNNLQSPGVILHIVKMVYQIQLVLHDSMNATKHERTILEDKIY